jgi:hypothetical protein
MTLLQQHLQSPGEGDSLRSATFEYGIEQHE